MTVSPQNGVSPLVSKRKAATKFALEASCHLALAKREKESISQYSVGTRAGNEEKKMANSHSFMAAAF
jgi:hypothetical protein